MPVDERMYAGEGLSTLSGQVSAKDYSNTNQAVETRSNTIIDDRIAHVDEIDLQLCDCILTLKGLRDRNLGAVPECDETSDKPIPPDGKIHVLAGRISTLHDHVSTLRTVINDLNERL